MNLARPLRLRARLPAFLSVILALSAAAKGHAAEVTAAVAANFTEPAKEIAAAFETRAGDRVNLSFGSSGTLYTQITQGAPFDILLSADAARPAKAEKEGWGMAGTRFTYAIGRIVLWSADPALVDEGGAVLKTGKFTHLAIANPKSAPYGAAAIETLKALGVYAALEPKIVTGESIAQAYQFVASGNAEIGFVALSQLIGETKGSRWLVPVRLYSPIRQDAILLKAGARSAAAQAFLRFLKSPDSVKIIERYGYAVPSGK